MLTSLVMGLLPHALQAEPAIAQDIKDMIADFESAQAVPVKIMAAATPATDLLKQISDLIASASATPPPATAPAPTLAADAPNAPNAPDDSGTPGKKPLRQ